MVLAPHAYLVRLTVLVHTRTPIVAADQAAQTLHCEPLPQCPGSATRPSSGVRRLSGAEWLDPHDPSSPDRSQQRDPDQPSRTSARPSREVRDRHAHRALAVAGRGPTRWGHPEQGRRTLPPNSKRKAPRRSSLFGPLGRPSMKEHDGCEHGQPARRTPVRLDVLRLVRPRPITSGSKGVVRRPRRSHQAPRAACQGSLRAAPPIRDGGDDRLITHGPPNICAGSSASCDLTSWT